MFSSDDPPVFLSPYPVDRFIADHYERRLLHIKRSDGNHFRDVIGLDDIDKLVTSVRIPVTNFNLAQGDTPIRSNLYCFDGSYVDKVRVLSLHEQGATIILRAIEQWSPKLNRLRICAERFFGCVCQINVYVTPPGKKSTPPHWDTHDLIVMQIGGRKVWRIYGGERTLPLTDERFRVGEDFFTSDYDTLELSAGDTLYLPRGVIHEPVASSYSVHLSIGIHTIRWHDVLELGLRLLADEEGSPLRSGASQITSNSLTESAKLQVLTSLLDPRLLSRSLDILKQRFEANRAVDLQGSMFEIGRFSDAEAGPVRAPPLIAT